MGRAWVGGLRFELGSVWLGAAGDGGALVWSSCLRRTLPSDTPSSPSLPRSDPSRSCEDASALGYPEHTCRTRARVYRGEGYLRSMSLSSTWSKASKLVSVSDVVFVVYQFLLL